MQKYQNGESAVNIAKERGINASTIFRWLKKQKKHRKYTEKFKQEILQKYQNGESAIHIAKEKGINPSIIFRSLKKSKQQNIKISNSTKNNKILATTISNWPKKRWIRKFNKVSQDIEQQAKKDDMKEKPEMNFTKPFFLDSSISEINNKSEQLLINEMNTEITKQQHSEPWLAKNNSEVKIKQEILKIEKNFPIFKKNLLVLLIKIDLKKIIFFKKNMLKCQRIKESDIMTDDDSIYNNKNHTNVFISNFKSKLLSKDSVKYSPNIFFNKISF